MPEQLIPGEVVITTLSLFIDKGVVNLTEHISECRIVESIFNPGIAAKIIIWDTMNIASYLPILGSERLVIEFNAPGRESARYDLRLTSIAESEPASNMRTKAYTITAASPEVVSNKTERVCKSYKTNISNMVPDIVQDYLRSKKTVNAQPTRGIQEVIIPDVRPFDAINLLKKRSISVKDNSSSYLFFENKDGFHFRTIENIMEEDDVGDRVFYNNPTINADVKDPIFRNILEYDMPYQFDVIKRLDTGGMYFETRKFDYKTLTYEKTYTKFDASRYKSADGTLTDPDYYLMERNYGRTIGKYSWVSHDSGYSDTFIAESEGDKAISKSLYKQNSLSLTVFGDSEITAAQSIETNIIETGTATTAPELHAQLSGKYIIGTVEHIIGATGSNPRYVCCLECIKGGYKEIRS